ncbi:uncharacterized protein LOC110850460 [Folsomia candida]|uniref:uncharacterized protein LOC110850460 n=1 Tax=Folsomia candida TaxID=158441 RepID=UPI000B8F61CB|nr:uncharacterized protein LOC110850460 [Folsomia candida]
MRAFLNKVLAGGVPSTFCPFFFGASLTALKKKSGGIRPIAVGNTWRRLAAKIAVGRITPQLIQHFSPHQLGVGIKGGAEIGTHAARIYYNHPHTSPKAFLKIDFRNAFNEIRRDTLLDVVRDLFPSIFPFVAQCYASPSSLFYGMMPIPSLLGCQQGDPLGPAHFSLVVHPIVEAVETELNLWYLDDGAMGDPPENVLAALATVARMSGEVGLHLNTEKCEVGILGAEREEAIDILLQFQQVAPGIQLMSPDSAMLLGSPLTNEALEVVLATKSQQLATFSQRLLGLSAHSAFFLLRASISIPGLIYFLRCAPSWRKMDALTHYDATLKDALEGILNCTLSEAAWMQSSLPVKEGGLGREYSAARTSHLKPSEESKQRGSPILDKTLSHLSDLAVIPEDTARLRSLPNKYAGVWLTLPSPQLGTLLSNETFRVSVALRLGCDICQPHKCPCGAQVSSRGLHGLSSRRSAGRWSRHEAANDVIARALRSAEVPCIREPAGCSTTDGKRPDGMTLVPWARGRSLVWDFTCADTFAPSHLPDTVRHQGAAASKAEDAKKKKYAFLMDRYIFVPVAMETTGVWGQEGLALIEQIGQRIASTTGQLNAVNFLRQRVSLAAQRGNVASILGTHPPGKELEEVYYL